MIRKILLSLLITQACLSYSQIIINEVSQGPSGSKEYIELLVLSNGCNACVDIRGWIIDDNNGWHDSPIGTGQGIASGCLRFSYDNQWSCLAGGTLIVIYNQNDPNLNIPPIDENDSNNDCVYILSGNSMLLESNSTLPNVSLFSEYNSIPFSPGGSWSYTSMSNSNDSYQIIDPNNLTAPYFSIGWGNNDELQNIYFPGSATGDVMYMSNVFNNDPFNIANWTIGSALTEETPGLPNNSSNSTWISNLSNNCNPITPVLNLISYTDPICNLECNGTATIQGSGTTMPYSYLWDDPSSQTNATATGLCAGVYYPIVYDANGCTDSVKVILTNPSPLSATVSGAIANCNCTCPGSIYVFPIGGTPNYSILWSNGFTDQFQTRICIGTYMVTITDSNGCSVTDTITLP